MTSEKKPRQHNRYWVKTMARIRKQGGKEDWVNVHVITLSPMGACFDNANFLSPSDMIEFYMPSPASSNAPYYLSARVIWIKDGQVGVEFTGKLKTG